MRGLLRQVAVVVAVVFNVGLNGLAGAGVLFDAQTGAVSDANPTGLTPAGWAFSIWSVIFMGVVAFAAWQATPSRRGARYDRLGVPFVAANLLNGLWQIPWMLERFGLAALVIVGILGALAWLYVRLDAMALRGVERWALGVPVSLFLAWLTVATPLNVTIWLQSIGWTSASPLWPAALVLVVVGVSAALLLRTGDVAAALVFLWAYAAIYAAHGDNGALAAVLGLGALAVVAATVAGARRHSPWPTAHATSG
ncbi:MAG: TspO/MBR family protein [Bacteroidota bacterium]